MATGGVEHLPDRAVVGNRVRRRPYCDERVRAVVAAAEPAAQMILGALRTLDRIQAVSSVLPDVELGARHRGAADVADVTVDQRRDAAALLGEVGAVLAQRGARGVERAEHRRLGRAGGERVLERVDEH